MTQRSFPLPFSAGIVFSSRFCSGLAQRFHLVNKISHRNQGIWICTNFEKYGEIEQLCQIWELITSSCREQKVRQRDGGLEKQRRRQSRDIQVWLQWLFLIANNFSTTAWNLIWMPDLCSALSALLCSGAAFLLGLISGKSVLLAFSVWKS